MVNDDKAIEIIVSMFMEIQDRENTTLPVLEKELKETEKAIQNIVSAVEKGMFSEALIHRMEALEAAKEDLTIRIEMEKLEKPKVTEKEMTFFLHRFRKLNPNIEAHRQILIDTFVNAVYVYDDKLLLTFNFQEGTRTISYNAAQAAAKEKCSDMNCSGAPEKATCKSKSLFQLYSPYGELYCFYEIIVSLRAQLGISLKYWYRQFVVFLDEHSFTFAVTQ